MRYFHDELSWTFKGLFSDKHELYPGSDLVHAELTSAACRADPVFNLGFIRDGVTYRLFSL